MSYSGGDGREPSELDAFLGHARKVEAAGPLKPTGWPKVEERLRSVLDTWVDVRGFMPRSKFEVQEAVAGARDFVDSIGERPDLLREAMLDYQSRGKGHMMSSPRSCISWCRNKLIRDKPREPEDYLLGAGKDFFDNGEA